MTSAVIDLQKVEKSLAYERAAGIIESIAAHELLGMKPCMLEVRL